MDPRDSRRIVELGYDRIAERHAEWATRTRTDERARYLDEVTGRLPAGASVLELGCGVAGAVTQELASRFRLTGVDLSGRSVEIARRSLPDATILHGDMTQIDLPPASFDAVVAFYSVIHVPRDEHAALFTRIATWLRPGGVFVASLGTDDEPHAHETDWLGVPMVWSAHDAATGRRLVEDAGLTVERAAIETADEDGAPVSFLWIIARRAE